MAKPYTMISPPAAGSEPVGFPVFWHMLSRMVAALLGERAFADVVLIMRDGKISQVRVNRTFLPEQLPKV